MSNRRDHEPVSDEDLVAYIDGLIEEEDASWLEREVNMDKALAARLDLLRRGDRPFTQAYDLLLHEAPNERLKRILKLVKEPPPPPAAEPEPEPPVQAMQSVGKEPWGGWRVLAAAAALLAMFAGGLVTSRFVPLPGEQPQSAGEAQAQGWRAAVAYYQTLYVKETLENESQDAHAQSANLRAALARVGLDLSVEMVSAGPFQFKRAAVLNYKGKPLVQVAYLFNGETPVSFCIINSAKPARGAMAEQREGLNIVHWRSGKHSFMIIGDVPHEDLNRIAHQLRQQLS
ncbi:MAG: hypothetical protein ACE5FM_08560 [Methyloligellaceae bacterium]